MDYNSKRMIKRWYTSILFLVVLGLIVGALIAIPVIPRPNVGTITISGAIMDQDYTDDILEMLSYARDESSIKAVVLKIDSPGGAVSVIEQIYLDLLQLKQQKPVVASIGASAASGGYHIAVATDYIYAEPTSIIGSIGVIGTLPSPEDPDEDTLTSGPFKATGGSRRKVIGWLETIRQQFVGTVMSHRGERLRLSETEISRAEIYIGTEGLRYGLIDDIGTSSVAIEKAASLAGVRNYGVVDINEELGITEPFSFFFSLEDLKSRSSLMPAYYYLHFELR